MLILIAALHLAAVPSFAASQRDTDPALEFWKRDLVKEKKLESRLRGKIIEVDMSLQVENVAEASGKIHRLLRRHGGVLYKYDGGGFDPMPSRSSQDSPYVHYIVDAGELEAIKSALAAMTEKLSWSKTDVSYFEKALRKWTILTREVDENEDVLEDSPNIAKLVMEEIDRLTPSVREYAKSKKRVDIDVLLIKRFPRRQRRKR